MLTGLNHLTLAVRNLSRSVDFYRDILGCRLSAQWDQGAYLSLGELWICLSVDANKEDAPVAHYTHYAFSVSQEDFPQFQRELQNSGVTEWKNNGSEGDSFYFLDPDGHKLELHVGTLKTRLAQCRAAPYSGMRFFD